MSAGRKRTRTGNEKCTTIELDPGLELAIARLQTHRLERGQRKPTMRELFRAGIDLQLREANLPQLPEPEPNRVIEFTKRKGGQ